MSQRPFGDLAPFYGELGLITVPLGSDKRPVVKHWQKFQPRTYEKLLDKFSDCNIGAVNGRGPLPITVIDIDDPDERDWCRARFGDTPVKVRTPSGGEHWYFRASGEGRHVRYEGHKVDILGLGGYGVLPPSKTPRGCYEFLTGDAWSFADLPTLVGVEQSAIHREVEGRNSALFSDLRSMANSIDDHERLFIAALKRNADFQHPLPRSEVEWIAKSVWRYKSEGRLLVRGCEAVVINTASTLDACAKNPDSLYLLSRLKQYHGSKHGKPFVLANTMAASLGWSTRRFRRARDHLIDIGELELVHKGQKGRSRATMVRLPKMGQIDQQCNPTVPPLEGTHPQ